MQALTNQNRFPRGIAKKKIATRRTFACIAACLVAFAVSPWARADVQTYSSPGTYTWTAPAGVWSVQVECWGPGGDGGGPWYDDNGNGQAGGGGGGGAYAKVNSFAVISGSSYTVLVGAHRGYPYYDTLRTTFNTTTCVADYGGNGGQPDGGGSGQASN